MNSTYKPEDLRMYGETVCQPAYTTCTKKRGAYAAV